MVKYEGLPGLGWHLSPSAPTERINRHYYYWNGWCPVREFFACLKLELINI